MNTEPIISIVIPMFNMECFIKGCLTSLFNQDLADDEFEILVINDGSSDQSRGIVESLQPEHRNLILVNQENKGVSVARNIGTSMAKGKFVIFVDADDYVKTFSFKNIVEKADTKSHDVIFLKHAVSDQKGNLIGTNDYSEYINHIYNGIDAYKITHLKTEKDPDRSWGIIFKTSFLKSNHLEFLADIPYLEDGHFTGKVLCMADKCSFDNDLFYIHVVNPDSVSRSDLYNTEKARHGFYRAAIELSRFSEKQNLNTVQKKFLTQLVAKFVISAVFSAVGSKKIVTLFKVKHNLKELGLNKLMTNELITNLKYAKLYNKSYWLLVGYYCLETRINLLINIFKSH